MASPAITTGHSHYAQVRLPVKPGIWLVALHGHCGGQCDAALRLDNGWKNHTGHAGAIHDNMTPAWLIWLVLGPHDACQRKFMSTYFDMLLINSHMFPELSIIQDIG